MIRTALMSVLLISFQAVAAIPPMKVTELGKPDAPIKGTFFRNLESEPETFNPIQAQDLYSRHVYEVVMEGLLRVNPDTYKLEPELAERYEISKDGLTYTFFLNKKAKWADGKPVTSEDVKFSIECVRNPAYMAASRIPYYEDVASIETPDAHTVVFKMKKKYFMNDLVLGVKGFTPIVPKHLYGDPKAKHPIAPIYGSGPYKVESYSRGKNIVLVRNPNYWGKDEPGLRSMAKFERINYRFIKEDNLQLEMTKKGQIDFLWPVTSENFETKAVGAPFGTDIKKVKADNSKPKSWSFVAWNQKHQIFKEKDIRHALALLWNIPLIQEKYTYNNSVPARGVGYYKSPFMPPDLKPVGFDPAAAKKILTKNGWADKDKNGVLEKTIDGKTQEFRFSLMFTSRDSEKYFTIYKEDLKKAGIDMELKLVEWSTFTKILDEQRFDAVALAWGGGSPEPDLKQIWHSDSARGGGSNFISYSNKEVDKLIDQARGELDLKKRTALWQKANRLIALDYPYALMFNPKYDLYLLNKRIDSDRETYTYDLPTHYMYLRQ